MAVLRLLLLPVGVIYGLVTWLRNKAFDLGFYPSQAFDIPIIGVGNLSMGGTGKTPHVEYLIRLLSQEYRVATLSRGYRRKTKGFLIADQQSNAETLGDEPFQYYRKYPGITVAVSEQRKEGIEKLLAMDPRPEVILLDDAFQHRWVKPGLSVLLTDYHKPFTKDYIFPVGKLREFRWGYSRADILVVTKTPKIFSPITRRTYEEDIRPLPKHSLYFSFLKYDTPLPLFPENTEPCKESYTSVLMVTGIANPDPLEIHLKESGFFRELEKIIYPDHHLYSEKDVSHISKTFHNIVTRNKVMITTEKDAMRLIDPSLSVFLKDIPVYYFPIEVDFHQSDKPLFDQQILDHVRENKRNH